MSLMILPTEKPHLFCLNIPPFHTCSDCCKAEWFGNYPIDKPGLDAQTTCVCIPEGFVLFPEHTWTYAEVCWGQTLGDGTSSLPIYKNHCVEWLRRVRVRFGSLLLRGRTLPGYLSLPLLLCYPGWYDHMLCGTDAKICFMKALTTRQEQQVISPAGWVLKPFLCRGRKLFLTSSR